MTTATDLDYAATLGRIMAGADATPIPENAWPTVGQLWHKLLTSTQEEREERLARYLRLCEQRTSDLTQGTDWGRVSIEAMIRNSEAKASVALDRDPEAETVHLPEAINVGDQTIVEVTVPPTIHDLIEASSLGEPDAVAARARVTDEEAAAVVARAAALTPEDLADDIEWDDAPDPLTDARQAALVAELNAQHAANGLDEFAAPTAPAHNPVNDDLNWEGPDDLALAAAEEAKAAPAASESASAATVRAWAKANGVKVPARGAVPDAVRDAYNTANA